MEELGDTNCVNWPALSPLSDHDDSHDDESVTAWKGSSSSSWSSASVSDVCTDYNSSLSSETFLIPGDVSSAVPVFSGESFSWNDGIDATLDFIPDMDAENDRDGLLGDL